MFKKVGGKETYTIKWLPDLSWADHRIPEGGARAVVTAWALDNTPDYMVVDISEGAQPHTQQYYCSTNFLPGGLLGNDDYRTSKIVMRKIMAKNVKWTMGSINEDGRTAAREASHTVQLTNNYYIGVFELTQSQYTLARAASSTAKPSPSFRREEYRAMRPMEQISYNEIRAAGVADQAYSTSNCWPAEPGDDSLLKLLRNKTNIDFDLPTEAQWEVLRIRTRQRTAIFLDGTRATVKPHRHLAKSLMPTLHAERRLSAVMRPTPGGFTICTVTSMNGVLTGLRMKFLPCPAWMAFAFHQPMSIWKTRQVPPSDLPTNA